MIIKCVGGLITGRCCSADYNINPKFLKDILTLNIDETEFEILNFGVGGRTAQITGDYPYVNEPYW